MRVMSDKLSESLARQQANRRMSRIVEIQENEYRDFKIKLLWQSFC